MKLQSNKSCIKRSNALSCFVPPHTNTLFRWHRRQAKWICRSKKKKTGGLSKKKKNEIKITSKRNLCAWLSFYLWFLQIEKEKNHILRVLRQFALFILNLTLYYFIFQSYNFNLIPFIHTWLCMFLGQLRFDFLIFFSYSFTFCFFFLFFFLLFLFLLIIASFWKNMMYCHMPFLITFSLCIITARIP